MDARALAAPQKDPRGTFRPARSSSLAASLFRCGAAAQHSSRHREHRVGNFSSISGHRGTATSSQAAFGRPDTTIPRPTFARAAVRSATRHSATYQFRINRSRPPSTRRARTRWPGPRAGGCPSICPSCRERIRSRRARRARRGGIRGRRRGRGAGTGSATCGGRAEASSSSCCCRATSAERRGGAGDRASGIWKELVVQTPQRSAAVQ
jgi:hypothetical protein